MGDLRLRKMVHTDEQRCSPWPQKQVTIIDLYSIHLTSRFLSDRLPSPQVLRAKIQYKPDDTSAE